LRRWWLVRTTAGEWRTQLEMVRQGLRIEYREPVSGVYLLGPPAPGRLRMIVLAPRLLVVILPAEPTSNKIRLLKAWLGKCYPPPLPRWHVDRSRCSRQRGMS